MRRIAVDDRQTTGRGRTGRFEQMIAAPLPTSRIDLEFTEHISKIVHIGHSRAALILKCFHARSPEV